MPTLRRRIIAAQSGPYQLARRLYWALQRVSLPAPKVVIVPARLAFVGIRTVYYFLMRVLVCEPMFKSYCTTIGRRFRMDVFTPWVQGSGRLEVGDDVSIHGKISFTFASRFSDEPTLVIGDGTVIGHNTSFVVGRRIEIGRMCLISSDVWIFDSSGHPSDPEARFERRPPDEKDVKPVKVHDNVWISTRCIIHPGSVIGEGSIIAAAAVVRGTVPPYTVFAGNPARQVATLRNPNESRAPADVIQ